MPVHAAARTLLWVSRALVAVAAISGLFAMHGPPGLDTAVASAPQMSAHEHMPDDGAVQFVRSVGRPVTGVDAGTDCGMDHSGCVAVLRDSSQRDLPVAAVAVSEHVPAALGGHVVPVSMTSRAPPDVCLNRLCISRT